MSLVGLVSSHERALWVFCGSKSFSRGQVVGPNFFLVSILWVQKFFSLAFCRELRNMAFASRMFDSNKFTRCFPILIP